MKSLHLWLIVCLLVCSLVVINATTTRKIYVNQRTGNDENNGSEHSPVRTIQRGVDIANSSDIVLLSSGAHYLYREVFINKTGITIQSLEADEVEPLVSSEDKLAVIVAFKVIGQVMFIHNAQNVSIRYVVLRDATVWNLVETRPELDIPCGGALMISYSSFISVEHVKMQNNLAAYGGATCIYNSQNVTFTQCEITKNAAIIRNNVLHNELNNLRIGRVSNFNISNSDFFGNIPLYKTYSSDFGSGGGIAIMNSTGVTFYESIISNNTAADEGGALYIVGSTVHIERSQISGNIGFKQSSTIYSDISSDVYLDTIYFYENYCVHSQCRLLFSEKRSLLQDNLVFRKYVFPVVSVTGTVLSIVLLCVIPLYSLLMHVFRYISYRRLQKDQDVKEKKERLIRSDRVVLWLFESFAIYYPEGTSNLRIFIHRSIVVVVIVLSTVYAGMSYASTFPLYYDEFDRIKYVFYVVEHIYYYFIPLVVFFGMIRAANLSAEKLFSSNYSKAFENSFDKETERQLLLMTNHVPQDEDEITTFHTNSRKRYNRRAIVAVIWAFAYANIMYAIVVVDVFNFVKSQRLISGIMQENVKLDTWTVSVFTLLHWYLSFCLISFMLCVLYLICNRINALTRLYFDELHYKLKTGTFTLQWGIEGFVKLRREQKILNNDTYPIAVTYAALFVILLGIETLVILWGQSENGYFIFYVISMVILLVTVTNVSYTANKFVSSNFDDFVLSAFEESQEMQQVQSTGKHDVTADASIVTILSNRDRMLRDLTHFHGYIRNRIFSYSFPYEANLQTSTVFTLISLGGFSYGLVKYLSSSIPSEFIYRQY